MAWSLVIDLREVTVLIYNTMLTCNISVMDDDLLAENVEIPRVNALPAKCI